MVKRNRKGAHNEPDFIAVFPEKETKKLVEYIKGLTVIWAQEEQLMGNTIFYWNLLSSDEVKKIAYAAPTTVEEFAALGLLSEKNYLEEYGSRLARHIRNFVTDESLNEYVDIDRFAVLPYEPTKKLMEYIKNLTVGWAQEDRLEGRNVSYWNILSPGAVKSIAYAAPTTSEEITALGLLSEPKLDEYGDRLVLQIRKFVTDESLEEYFINMHPPVLSDEKTTMLMLGIKNLTVIWAQEEQLLGNTVSYCSIISADAITSIVDAVPTTVEELAALEVLQEQTLQDYGDRLLRYIAKFMIYGNLEENTKNRIVLSYEETKKLEERIKNLTFIWAQEEKLLGNTSVFYWNILSPDDVRSVAATVPTTVKELAALELLSEQKLEEYGDSLVRHINKFLRDEDRQESEGCEPTSKRARLSERDPSVTSASESQSEESEDSRSAISPDEDEEHNDLCDLRKRLFQ